MASSQEDAMRALVAVDLDKEETDGDVMAARPLVERLGARVDVLYVDGTDRPLVVPDAPDELKRLIEYAQERHDADVEDRLLEVLEVFHEPHRGDAHVATGRDSAAAIAASVPGHDLLVVSTHGRQGLARAWHGSVAETVVRSSEVPVLVVRGTTSWRPNARVLAAVDVFDPGASRFVQEAASWARRLGAHLDLVHVVPCMIAAEAHGAPSHAILADASDELALQAEATLLELSRRVPADVRGVALVELGDPATTLAEMSSGYAVLVVRTHARRGIGRFVFGSIAEQLVRRAPGAVLVLPPERVRAAA
jgi:nucleotide-binding universal stress UspA family protein